MSGLTLIWTTPLASKTPLASLGSPAQASPPACFFPRITSFVWGKIPIRIEILTSISGVDFATCYAEREMIQMEEVAVPVISLARLRENKAASGRAKDLADLENLPR